MGITELLAIGKATYEWVHRLINENRDDMTPEERAAYEADLKSRFEAARQRLRDAQNP